MTFSWQPQRGYRYGTRSGGWYFITGGPVGTALTTNLLYLIPVNTGGCTLDSLALRTTAASVGAVGRFCIYSDIAGLPGLLLYESLPLDVSVNNVTVESACNTAVGDGVIWLGFVNQVAGQSFVTAVTSQANVVAGMLTGTDTTAGINTAVGGHSLAGVAGALPATLVDVALTNATVVPRFGWKIA